MHAKYYCDSSNDTQVRTNPGNQALNDIKSIIILQLNLALLLLFSNTYLHYHCLVLIPGEIQWP